MFGVHLPSRLKRPPAQRIKLPNPCLRKLGSQFAKDVSDATSLDELKKKIERQGMKFATLRPEAISADLAALYLSVKRSQSL